VNSLKLERLWELESPKRDSTKQMAEEDFNNRKTQPIVSHSDTLPSDQLEIPKFIGPYKIESLLEKGGMSILYLGTHPETKQPTTIKVLSPKFLTHPEAVKRFIAEAEIIAMADHPNIVKLYGHGEWEGGLYIAMEFIEGISLRQYILRYPLSLKQSLEMTIDIAYALCHLHTHGVIHRDLKPENILIDDKGVIKVIDFGIAQLLADEPSSSLNKEQKVIGTPIYMSPEQRKHPDKVGYPSDIYSLGIIAYELILGKLCHGRIHLSLIPQGLQKILTLCLQPGPEDRYQDVVDFITALSEYMHTPAFKRDSQPSDQLSEISEKMKLAGANLVPHTPPIRHHIEIATGSFKTSNISGLYYDFYNLPGGKDLIISIESTETGIEGIIYTAVVRGMIKVFISQTSSVEDLFTKLNQQLLNDNIPHGFLAHTLVLDSQSNSLQYSSCGPSHLWALSNRDNNVSKIERSNPILGIDTIASFETTSARWELDDTLLLSTFNTNSFESNLDILLIENFLQQSFLHNRSPSPQSVINGMINNIRTSKEVSPMAQAGLVHS
jgi:serine/threonine protein kinase